MRMERVVREALELPEAERARLVDRLIVSLGMDEDLDGVWEEWAWVEEVGHEGPAYPEDPGDPESG